MIKRIFPVLSLFSLGIVTASAQKLVVKPGLKVELLTTAKMNTVIESLGQNIVSENIVNTVLENKSVTDTGFLFTSTVTRMRTNTEVMGQKVAFDSDSAASTGGPMADAMKKVIGSTQQLYVNKEGKISRMDMGAFSEDENAMMQGFNMVNTLSKGQPFSLLYSSIAKLSKKGDTWTDSTGTNDSSKTVYTYTLRDNTGDELSVDIAGKITIHNAMKVQEMDLVMNLNGTTNGNSIFQKSTGVLKHNLTALDIKGSMEVMGQTTPMSISGTTSVEVKAL